MDGVVLRRSAATASNHTTCCPTQPRGLLIFELSSGGRNKHRGIYAGREHLAKFIFNDVAVLVIIVQDDSINSN